MRGEKSEKRFEERGLQFDPFSSILTLIELQWSKDNDPLSQKSDNSDRLSPTEFRWCKNTDPTLSPIKPSSKSVHGLVNYGDFILILVENSKDYTEARFGGT